MIAEESFAAIACSAVTNCPFELAHAHFVLTLPTLTAAKISLLLKTLRKIFMSLKVSKEGYSD